MMEEFYIEKLLEHSRRLPVIKQFLLLLLDYAQLEKYCFQLFDGKWNTERLYEFAIKEAIVIPWNILVTDQYKWNYFLSTIRCAEYCNYEEYLSGENLDALKYIMNTRYEYNGKRYYCKFTRVEQQYICEMLRWVGIGQRNQNSRYSGRILRVNTTRKFRYKEKIEYLKVCYETALRFV